MTELNTQLAFYTTLAVTIFMTTQQTSDLESNKPFAGEFWSATNCLVPHNWKISHAAEVLCNGNCAVKVNNNMPPATRHKDCLTRLLKYLNLPPSHDTPVSTHSTSTCTRESADIKKCGNKLQKNKTAEQTDLYSPLITTSTAQTAENTASA